MKRFVLWAAALAVFSVAPAAIAQSQDLIPGTQVRIRMQEGLSTSVAHNGDPFTAIVTEPVFQNNVVILPAGAKLHGTVTSVNRPRMFAMIRGGASMNLVFNSIEIESRLFPARMSILDIYNNDAETGKKRKDLSTVEGVVVQQRHDLTTDVEDVALGTAGGSVVGLVFSHVMRGTLIGLVGGSAYVVAKKGKEVELPAQTGLLVRMDSTVSVPTSLMHTASYQPNGAQ
jgi:hypothetical protein